MAPLVQYAEAAAFVRADDKALFPEGETTVDTTSGPEAPDLELFVSPMGYRRHGTAPMPLADAFGLHATLLRYSITSSKQL